MGNAASDGSGSPKKSPKKKAGGASKAVVPVVGDARQNAGIPKKKNAVLPAENLASNKSPPVVKAHKINTTSDANGSNGPSPPKKPNEILSPILDSRMTRCIDQFTTTQSRGTFALNKSILNEANNESKATMRHFRDLLNHLLFSDGGSVVSDLQFEKRLQVLDTLDTPEKALNYLFDYLHKISGSTEESIDANQFVAEGHENSPSRQNASLYNKERFQLELIKDPEISESLESLLSAKPMKRRASASPKKESDWSVAWAAVDKKRRESKKSEWMSAWEGADTSKQLTHGKQ